MNAVESVSSVRTISFRWNGCDRLFEISAEFSDFASSFLNALPTISVMKDFEKFGNAVKQRVVHVTSITLEGAGDDDILNMILPCRY